MKLTKIETKSFNNIRGQINTIHIESSGIENMDEFYDEDIENRIDDINQITDLLNKEKELLIDILDVPVKNNDDIMNDEIILAANKLHELVLKYENNDPNDLSLRTAVLKYLAFYWE